MMNIKLVTCGILVTPLILVPLQSAFGAARNLSVNAEITAKIRAVDTEFFKKFHVYRAAVREYPTALLFDPKDEYTIAGRFWGEPLSEDEVNYAIARLDEQYHEPEQDHYGP